MHAILASASHVFVGLLIQLMTQLVVITRSLLLIICLTDYALRDRAEERRRGINPDYVSSSLLVSGGGGGGQGGMTPHLGSQAVDVSRLSVEESKFLGGDIEFTHLVKGLDFALLQKERSKLQQQFVPRGVLSASGGDASTLPASASTSSSTAPKEDEVKFHGPLARNVYNLLFKPTPKANVSELFLPKRLAFSYNLSGADEDDCLLDGISSDLPTVLRRSKAECPPVPSMVVSCLDPQVMDKIQKVMSYLHTGGKKMKKKEGKEGMSEEQAKKPLPGLGVVPRLSDAPVTIGASLSSIQPPKGMEDDDDDIFGDAGTDYKPSVSNKKEGQNALSSVSAKEGNAKVVGSYFEGKDHLLPTLPDTLVDEKGSAKGTEAEEGELLPTTTSSSSLPSTSKQGSAADAAIGAEKWRIKAGKVEEKHVDFEETAYGECYPMQAGFAGEVLDSDDEDGKAPEAGPEGEGKAKGKEKDKNGAKVSNKEAGEAKVKINNQLTAIEKIFKDKGQDHATAFKDKAGGAEGKGKGGAKRGGEGHEPGIDPSLMTPMRGKKQRI